jgi:hypothetical protein
MDRGILLEKLFKLDLDTRVKTAVQALLQPSSVRVVLGPHVSEEFMITSGVPQGGILSPLLFNFYLSELGRSLKLDTDDTRFFQIEYYAYADDLAITISGCDPASLLDAATHVNRYVNNFFASLRLQINMDKSGTMLVTHLRPFGLVWPNDLPPRVLEYKYLGCIIDSKLSLKSWCHSLVKAIRDRVILIKRLSATRLLSRPQVETLYSAVVRGKLMYACSLWSRSKFAYKVLQADKDGQRITMGALIATPYDLIEKESNLTPLVDLIRRADLRLYLAIRGRPQLRHLDTELDRVLDPLNEVMEHTILYSIGMQPYLHGLLDDSFTLKNILEKIPSKIRKRSRVSFRNEVILARFRMGYIPTRLWATRVGLSDNPLCRHCNECDESAYHLIHCAAIPFPSLLDEYSFLLPKDISEALTQSHDTFQVENSILEFVARNNLFRLGNASPSDLESQSNTTKKRKTHISPSPQRPKKRSKRNCRKRPLKSTNDTEIKKRRNI